MAVQDDVRENEQRVLFGLVKPEGEGRRFCVNNQIKISIFFSLILCFKTALSQFLKGN